MILLGDVAVFRIVPYRYFASKLSPRESKENKCEHSCIYY